MRECPYLDTLPRRVHISHRGGGGLLPENTMIAFADAVERWRTDVLELDVRPSADGAVMVFHDEALERTTEATGAFSARTRAELEALDAGFHHPDHRGRGVRIPSFEAVLAAFPSHHLNVELKEGGDAFVDAFVALVRRFDAERRVCIGHLDDARAIALHAKLSAAAMWYPHGAATRFVTAVRSGDAPPDDAPWRVLALPHRLGGAWIVDEALVAAAHRVGAVVHAWTVDDPDEMNTLFDAGVDGIMTDRPDVLRAVMSAR